MRQANGWTLLCALTVCITAVIMLSMIIGAGAFQ